MLATHSLSLSLSHHSSLTPTTRTSSRSNSRSALADSTNFSFHSNICGPSYQKSCVFPTSSARIGCGWNDLECSTTPSSTSVSSRHHHASSAPSPFLVTYKAPPTVSVSLSAACSQGSPGQWARGSRVQSSEPDLPDVKSVVPFPTTPLDGDMDVDMFDGTCTPCSDSQSLKTPRKRHSAQSSVSSSPCGIAKEAKPKRPRKSKRQVAELWWLGVVHRSILRGIEARQSIGQLDTSDRLPNGPRDLGAMDRLLAEKIQRRLADNGCVEGRALPNPLPRISSPSISVPSLMLVAPSRKVSSTGSVGLTQLSELNPDDCGAFDGTATSPSASKPAPRASPSITCYSHTPTSSTAPTPRRPHVRFETPQQPRESPLLSSVPRRSPSPPARTGTVSSNAQTHTLTMPQLVASLTLAYHERSGLRLRGRSYKNAESEKNAGRSQDSIPCRDVCSDAQRSFEWTRARLSSAPEKKSPLSRVAYTES